MIAIEELADSVSKPLPACLPWENPHRLVSLYEMLQFNADAFCRISGLIGQMFMDIQNGRVPQERSFTAVASSLGEMQRLCESLRLPATLAQLARLKRLVSSQDWGSVPLQSFARELMEVHVRLVDELEARRIFLVPDDRVPYLEANQFPQIAVDRFQDAVFDMDEASKCYALERATACVFHLMRVTEYGLVEVQKTLKITNPLGPNWDQIIKFIDAELKAEYRDRKFKGQADLLAHISSHMNAVKVAWRNKTMHVDRKHTMEEAREIFHATVGLMRYLSENLPKQVGVINMIRGMMKP